MPRVSDMHAVVIRDSKLHWEERENPVPGDTELLVAVRAAGLNGADMMQRLGRYPAPPGAPADIPGMELAGEVVALGSRVSRFAPGDRVMGLVGGGAQATMAVIEESHALAVPDSLPWAEAGGFPEVFSTAFDALFTHARLSMGERVLVSGAAGGVGTAGVQLAAADRGVGGGDGARRGTARRGRRPGRDRGHRPGRGGRATAPMTSSSSWSGAASLPTVLPHLATGARVVVIGVGSGANVEINLLPAHGRAGQYRRRHAAGPQPPREGQRRGRRGAPTCCRSSPRAASGSPSAPPFPCPRPAPPMTGSPQAGSWGRSCSLSESG